ncbi:MAG TPA: fasciclin domain-containing protein [Dokdonella sp.]
MNASDLTPRANLVDAAAAQGMLTTFGQALAAAGLADTLKDTGPYTLFAPSDEAFARLPAGRLDDWMKPENKAELVSVLKYHIAAGEVSGDELGLMRETKTVGGEYALIGRARGRFRIDAASVLVMDILSSNGIIHVIDGVLMPARH